MHRSAAIVVLGLLLSPLAAAQPAPIMRPSLLLADVELVELAPADQRYDEAEDAARATMLSKRIRAAVVGADRYHVLGASENERRPPHRYTDCKACIIDWAHRHGADYVLVTWVQKESRLILMINMALIDVAHPDRPAAGGSVDLRGDTDQTWLAGASQMLDRTLDLAMPP